MSILELAKANSSDDHRIGNVFTENSYGIDRISVTLKEGAHLTTGSYVFLLDDDSYPVVYQVVQPYWFRPSFDFEESLITIGNPTTDSRIQRYRCGCTLVGKLTENAVGPPRNPVKPFANVYSCSPEIVAKVIHPDSDWTAKLGTNPETDRDVLIDLNTLVRQGLIVTGAQGTGKTTGLLTLVSRAMQATPPARFLLLDWTGEFASMTEQKKVKVQVINWELQLKGSLDSAFNNLIKASSNPNVRGLVIVTTKSQANTIGEHVAQYPEDFKKKFRVLTIDEINDAVEHLHGVERVRSTLFK
jgi:DNA helicase HerA-like ATPase